MSGFSTRVREAILSRDGHRCVRCGMQSTQIHHRRPRGMGGTTQQSTDEPANGVVLCGSGTTGCHGWVESHRSQAVSDGLIVSQGQEPATVPVLLYQGMGRAWYILDNVGLAHRLPA